MTTMQWVRNPDYDSQSRELLVQLEVGDRLLIAVPLHKGSGGGYHNDLIIADEIGFETVHGDSWGDWDWSDVEFYATVVRPT